MSHTSAHAYASPSELAEYRDCAGPRVISFGSQKRGLSLKPTKQAPRTAKKKWGGDRFGLQVFAERGIASIASERMLPEELRVRFNHFHIAFPDS